jgi:hypothetical protein
MVDQVPDYLKQNSKFIPTTIKVEKTQNTSGSTAGAGSGDFHQYRQLRRKERYRLVQMEAAARKQQAIEAHAENREDLRRECENRTLKKALKRRQKKEKLKLIKKMGPLPQNPTFTFDEPEHENHESESNSDKEVENAKARKHGPINPDYEQSQEVEDSQSQHSLSAHEDDANGFDDEVNLKL